MKYRIFEGDINSTQGGKLKGGGGDGRGGGGGGGWMGEGGGGGGGVAFPPCLLKGDGLLAA